MPSPRSVPNRPEYPEELWGVEDARIVRLDGLGSFAVTYTAYSRVGPLVALAMTDDFRTFERHGPIMSPEDKDAALFPRQFGWAVGADPSPRTQHRRRESQHVAFLFARPAQLGGSQRPAGGS